MIRALFGAIASTALLAGTPVSAQHAVATFDVAGVRLGDDPGTAKAALIKVGYRIDDVGTTMTLAQSATIEAARRQARQFTIPSPKGTGSIFATGAHNEHAEVRFVQRPGGSEVTEVTILIPGEALTTDALRALLLARYGKPDGARSMNSEWTWCPRETARVCGALFVSEGPLDTAYPKLAVTVRDGAFLTLDAGSLADEAAKREQEEAVLKLAPRTDQAAF